MTSTEPLPAIAPPGAPAQADRPSTSTRKGRLRAIGRPPRIMGLDIARGLAVIGMIAAHMADAPTLIWGDPSTWAGVVHGRSAILFALLAGVSTALITGRTHRPEYDELPALRALLVRRGIAIFVIGLALELLNTDIAVILCVYGVLFLCAIPFLRWRVRSLVIGAAALAVAGPLLLAALNILLFGPFGPGVDLTLFSVYPVPVWLALMLAGMAIGRLEFDRVRAAAGLLLIGLGLSVIGYVAGAVVTAQLDGAADYGPSAAAPIATDSAGNTGKPGSGNGMGDLVTIPGSQLADVDATGMTCDVQPKQWVNCWIPSDSNSGDATERGNDSYWSRLTASDPIRTVLISALAVGEHSNGIFEIIGSGGFAMAVLGLCLLCARPLRWILLPVACLGMMPLTTYSAHIVVYLIAAGGPRGTLYPSLALWAWTTAGLIAAATLWTVLAGRGPLERVVAAWAKRPAVK